MVDLVFVALERE